MNLPASTIERLKKTGHAELAETNEFGWSPPVKYNSSFFNPKRHIPPTNPNDDINMSPVENVTFAVCKSMQNIQILTGSNGCYKYCCKYMSKIVAENENLNLFLF